MTLGLFCFERWPSVGRAGECECVGDYAGGCVDGCAGDCVGGFAGGRGRVVGRGCVDGSRRAVLGPHARLLQQWEFQRPLSCCSAWTPGSAPETWRASRVVVLDSKETLPC